MRINCVSQLSFGFLKSQKFTTICIITFILYSHIGSSNKNFHSLNVDNSHLCWSQLSLIQHVSPNDHAREHCDVCSLNRLYSSWQLTLIFSEEFSSAMTSISGKMGTWINRIAKFGKISNHTRFNGLQSIHKSPCLVWILDWRHQRTILLRFYPFKNVKNMSL